MDFEIIENDKLENRKEIYIINENSFDCYPVINIDLTISIAYLNLGVDSEDMFVKCMWGLSPQKSWKNVKLATPCAKKGNLRLKGKYELGKSYRLDKDKFWESYFDETTGWYCLGNPNLLKEDVAVEIIQNMIIVLKNERFLKSVWIKPVFVEKHINIINKL